MRHRSGFSLIEVMVATMMLVLTAAIFAALVPQSARLRHKSENVTRATMLAQRKVEQIRALEYADLGYDALRTANVIDASPTSSPFRFTDVDTLSAAIADGAGTISITDEATDLRRVDVTVTWGGPVSGSNSVTLSTYIANRETMEISGS